MIKFYTSHCPQCKVIKMLMDRNNIEYTEIDDEDIYIDVANKNGIQSMPFAEIDNKILNTKQLREYMTKREDE